MVPHVLKNDRFAAFYGETFFFSGSEIREKGEKTAFFAFFKFAFYEVSTNDIHSFVTF